MPDDETIATILAICNLMGNSGHSVNEAVQAYQNAHGRGAALQAVPGVAGTWRGCQSEMRLRK